MRCDQATLIAAAVVGMSLASRATAQVRADPGTALGGKIAVRITVTLSDDPQPDHFVRGLRLRITRTGAATDSVTMGTDEAGVATLLLESGAYRVASVRPTEWKSRWYAWDVPLVVRTGMTTVELTGANAIPPGGTPLTVITGRPPPQTEPTPRTTHTPPTSHSPSVRTSTSVERSSVRLLSGSIGFVHTPNDDGMSMSLGLGGVLRRRLVGFVFPIDLAIVPNTDSRYYTDTFDNGNSVCRDRETGRFASKGNCGPDVMYAASAEAGFALTSGQHPIYVTGGYRVGSGPTGFGAVGMAFRPLAGLHWYGKGSVGRDFAQVVIGGSVPW